MKCYKEDNKTYLKNQGVIFQVTVIGIHNSGPLDELIKSEIAGYNNISFTF